MIMTPTGFCPAWLRRAALVILGGMLLASPVLAQPRPEETLLLQARKAVEAKKTTEAITAIETLRAKFPTTNAAADGTVLLLQIYLDQDPAKAQAVGTEILTRWPNSEYAWRAMEANCRKIAQTAKPTALATLEEYLKADRVPRGARIRALALRMQYLREVDPARYQTDALGYLKGLPQVTSEEELNFLVGLTECLYQQLMAGKQYAEAKAISRQLQEKIALLGNPANLAAGEARGYYRTLAQSNTQQFLVESKGLLQSVAWAESLQELEMPREVAALAYEPLIRAGRFTEARTCHTNLLAAYAQFGNPRDKVLADLQSYFGALSAANPALFREEVQPFILQATATTVKDDLYLPTVLAVELYPVLLQNGQFAEVQHIHDTLTAALVRLDNTERLYWERLKYLYALRPYSEQHAEAIVRLAAALQQQSTLEELGRAIPLVNDGYYAIRKHKGLPAIDTVYTQIMAALKTQGMPSELTLVAQEAYFKQLRETDVKKYLATVLPLVTEVNAATTKEAVLRAATLAQGMYVPLFQQGRGTEAKTLHADLQAALTRFGNPAGLCQADQGAYLEALSVADPAVFLAEALPLMTQVATAKTAADVQTYYTLATRLYAPMMKLGKFDETKALYEQMHAALTAQQLTEQRAKNTEAYRASISTNALDAMFALFKQALAGGDIAQAKKWLANMNTVAPEHPRAVQARKMFKQFEEQQDNPN